MRLFETDPRSRHFAPFAPLALMFCKDVDNNYVLKGLVSMSLRRQATQISSENSNDYAPMRIVETAVIHTSTNDRKREQRPTRQSFSACCSLIFAGR
jgi:hypothetical protein